MKKFMDPEMEIVMFSVEDIVTVSGDAGMGGSDGDDWGVDSLT